MHCDEKWFGGQKALYNFSVMKYNPNITFPLREK